ncbi:MAG TPA: TetR/AcrR family transcriptional regulator [Clostridiaceae bacterium]|nr:TetR/AcrR family transcriptional regulator [Clostridiaceae bacterium]
MYSNFEKLDPEKKERILNAALEEFAKSGYKNASTNEIVKKAGISKGILFHYFKDKQNLFYYLYDFAMERLMEDFYRKIDTDEPDFIERIIQITNTKALLSMKHPGLFRFIETMYIDEVEEASAYVQKINTEILAESEKVLFRNVDMSLFKEDVDLEKAMKIITWTFDGYGKAEFAKAKHLGVPLDYDRVFKESREYLEMFKKMFYKNV